jgi:hypothetical protein
MRLFSRPLFAVCSEQTRARRRRRRQESITGSKQNGFAHPAFSTRRCPAREGPAQSRSADLPRKSASASSSASSITKTGNWNEGGAPVSLAIRTVTATMPPRILIHGQEGVGKTTLAASFPQPVFLQTEDGTPGGLSLASFGPLETYPQVRDAIGALAVEQHDFKTAVVDSIDALETRIWSDVCATRGWLSIETPGYGKGYVEVDLWWHDILRGLDWLRRERGMIVVLLAHSAIESINDPRAPAYTSYQLRLHRRARGLVQDEMDVIGFLAGDLTIKTEDAGFSKTRHRADGGSSRWLHTECKPAFLAKNRYALPPKIAVPKDFDFAATLAPFFPPAAADQDARPTSKQTEPNHVDGIS